MDISEAYETLTSRLPGRSITIEQDAKLNARGMVYRYCVEIDGEYFCSDSLDRAVHIALKVLGEEITGFSFTMKDYADADDPRR